MKINWKDLRSGLLFTGTTAGLLMGSMAAADEFHCMKTTHAADVKANKAMHLVMNTKLGATDHCGHTGQTNQLAIYATGKTMQLIPGTGNLTADDEFTDSVPVAQGNGYSNATSYDS